MTARIRSIGLVALAGLLAGFVLPGNTAFAQAFGNGPPGTLPGSSMSGARIVGAPPRPRANRVPNARVFGDTAEERAFGRDVDDSYIRPKVRTGIRSGRSSEETATSGRSELNPINSGAYARQGPAAIGASSVTRGSSLSRGGRARIVKPVR